MKSFARHFLRERDDKTIIFLGFIACWSVCIGDFVVNFILGSLVPHYNFLKQPISYLGRTGSPVASWVKLWGILFCCFFLLFAIAWRCAFPDKPRLARQSSLLLILYGLGEGIGSGLIPYNKVNGQLTTAGLFHELFSGIGDIGLFIFPLLAKQIFDNQKFTAFRIYSWAVVIFSFLINCIFLYSKAIPSVDGMVSLLGLWQRLILLSAYTYLLLVSSKMLLNT